MKEGSIWRRWNFHVHTKGTNKNDQFTSLTMEEFFYTFYKRAFENEISAIGITDYYSIEKYIEAIEYRRDIENKVDSQGVKLFGHDEIEFIKNIFIFPNVELRMLPATNSGRLINIHCLFNPDYVPDLENDFFSHIENEVGIKMNRYGFIQYGKSLNSSIIVEQKQFEKGLENFVIDLKSLKHLVANCRKFSDNTLLVVSNSSNDGASAIQKHFDLFEHENGSLDGFRKSIYHLANGIFSSNPKDIKYFIGKRLEGTDGYNDTIYKNEIKEVIKNLGCLKPCIVGCDAHKEEDLFKKFTWIKADLNFEGLRQICFEPEQRVKHQIDKPDFKEGKFLIDKVQFVSLNGIFSTNPIILNPNLNVIIGGKSSGKSILLYAIAKTLSADLAVLKNDDGTFRYDLNKVEEDFDFKIKTKGGFIQRLNRNEQENSILPEIKYIPQNYLVKLAEPEINKKGQSLNKLVRDLITEDDDSKNLYQRFLNKVKQNDKLRNSQVDLYFETSNEIGSLEEELKNKSNKTVLEKNIESNIAKVEELNKGIGLSAEQVQEYKLLQGKLDKINDKRQKFSEDFYSIQAFNNDLVESIKVLKAKKDSIIEKINLLEIRNFCQTEYLFIDTFFKEAQRIEMATNLETKEDGSKYFKSDSKFNEILTTIVSEQKALTASIQPFLKDDQVKKTIEALNISISNDRKALQDILSLTKRIQEKKLLLDNCKKEIFSIYENNYNEYTNIIADLRRRTIELEKDGLIILGKAQFNFSKFRKELIAISDGRSASYNQYSILGANKKATDPADFKIISDEVQMLFDEVVTKKYVLTNRTLLQNAIKLILDDYFFDYWEITYKNDKLGEMSTGKASFVILMLIIGLSKSKAPILIDQPEDNLDNRSITTDLVNYLRNKKLERQIIVVTHNANIVVNADAENVIVANQKGQNDEHSTSPFLFDYINGSIENSFEKDPNETDILKSMGIRQHIADVVEGGKDAFIMRERKYRFH